MMNPRILPVALTALALTTFWACSVSNPARPSMSFAAPLGNQPANGAIYKFNQQPITLTIVNAVRTGGSPVTYNVEVSNNLGFTTMAYSRDGIADGSGGTTSVQIGMLEGGAVYYWRWRAVVDGIVGEASITQSFTVRPNVVINAPIPIEPAAGSSVFAARPTFRITNSTKTGPAETVFYEFQLSTSSSFASPLISNTVQEEQGPTTSWTPSVDLPEGTLFWRVKGRDPANDADSPFSSASEFERRFGIDLKKVVYQQGPDISDWPETSKITNAFHSDGQLCIEHTKLGVWPVTDFFDFGPILEGNQWVFANIGGVWYGGAADWYRPGQACKGVDEEIARDSFVAQPLGSWKPHPGEVFGVMSTTPARAWPAFKTLDQRTDVVLIVW